MRIGQNIRFILQYPTLIIDLHPEKVVYITKVQYGDVLYYVEKKNRRKKTQI